MKKATTEPTANPIGLRQRLARAQTLGQISLLLEESRYYDKATPKTKAAWHRTAERRRKELQG